MGVDVSVIGSGLVNDKGTIKQNLNEIQNALIRAILYKKFYLFRMYFTRKKYIRGCYIQSSSRIIKTLILM